jgi:hypothetical protein
MEKFPEVGDRDLAEILENRDSKNTYQSLLFWKNVSADRNGGKSSIS